jgi:hypothetical protein
MSEATIPLQGSEKKGTGPLQWRFFYVNNFTWWWFLEYPSLGQKKKG